jgi:hypothetical protein
MPQVFLSYSGGQRYWMEAFRKTELIEDELDARGANVIFDYQVDPITQGRYRQNIAGRLAESDVFVAIIDESYPTRKETLLEFDAGYSKFFRAGHPVPQTAFGMIFLDQKGLGWFNSIRSDSRRPFPEDTAYCRMFDYQGQRYPYTEMDRPNGAVIEDLRKFLRHICNNLGTTQTSAVAEPLQGPIPVVLLGNLSDPPPPIIASACEDLKHVFGAQKHEATEFLTLPHGWGRTAATDSLRKFAVRGGIFLFPVDANVARVAVTTPNTLADLLRDYLELHNGDASSALDKACLVYWMPAGIDSPRFRDRSQNGGEAVGPYFRTGSANEIAQWIMERTSPARPAPPIHYESAPLDRAVHELAAQLKNVLDGICRPPEPTALSFIPNERPLSEELSDIVKARGGIFITHSVNVEATANEVPGDLLQKVLRYVDSLEEFCAANGLKLEQIYRVALVRQRKEFWRGPWSIDVGRDNARLLGWRFLGIRKGETGFEMDERRVTQLISEVKTLVEPP